jgi:hypothetical protein
MEVQRLAAAAQLGQGWELIDPRQHREHVQQVSDTVGGQIGCQADLAAHRQLGVQAMDEGVMGDPTQPEPGGLVVGPGPHRGPLSGLADRVAEPAGAGQQPPRLVLGPCRYLEVVDKVVGTGLVARRSTMTAAQRCPNPTWAVSWASVQAGQVGTCWAGSASCTAAANFAVSARSSVS